MISKLTKKLFITNHIIWKPSLRSSFSNIRSRNSLLDKLVIDYNSPIAPPPLTLSLGILMFRTVAQVQTATQYRQKGKYYLLKQLLTQ